MPKLNVSQKSEMENKDGYDFQGKNNNEDTSKETSLLVERPDLIEIELFDHEKTEKKDEGCNKMALVSKTTSAQRDFDEYLCEAIEEVLSTMGEPVKNTVYFQLENRFNIPKNKIPKQIDEFTDIMHKIFGLGASRLEIKFMKKLQMKIKVDTGLTEDEWPLSKWIVDKISFTECVHSAREKYCDIT